MTMHFYCYRQVNTGDRYFEANARKKNTYRVLAPVHGGRTVVVTWDTGAESGVRGPARWSDGVCW